MIENALTQRSSKTQMVAGKDIYYDLNETEREETCNFTLVISLSALINTITSVLFSIASFVEIPDFMTPEEADHIIELAEESGFAKSDIHLDPKAKEHAQTLRSMEGNALYIT